MIHEPNGGHESDGLDESNPNSSPPDPGHQRKIIVEEELSYTIVGAFYEVYNELGYGFDEAVYSRALEMVLRAKGLLVEREVLIIVYFRGVPVGRHRLDMVVERRIVVENKATERMSLEVWTRQVRRYLTAARLQLGLLLHFGPGAKYYRILAPGVIHPRRRIRPNS